MKPVGGIRIKMPLFSIIIYTTGNWPFVVAPGLFRVYNEPLIAVRIPVLRA